MRHLCTRVHAGVCASGAVNVHRCTEKFGDGLLEQALHGDERFVALALEACKTGAVVAHGQFVGGHRITHLEATARARINATRMPATRSRFS